jgi:hypothetical protein
MSEEQRMREEVSRRLQRGILETKEGDRIHPSPDGKQFSITPRQVNAQLDLTTLIFWLLDSAHKALTSGYSTAYRNGVIAAFNCIPDADQDEKFTEEVKKCRYVNEHHTGNYKGYPPVEVVHTYFDIDPYALEHAVVNLLRRRGMTETPRLWEERPAEVFWAREGENAPVERIEDAKTEDV